MNEYTEHKGVILDRYEWAGGYGMSYKFVANAQSSRKREIKKGYAKLVKFN